jgi:hypothetical protein
MTKLPYIRAKLLPEQKDDADSKSLSMCFFLEFADGTLINVLDYEDIITEDMYKKSDLKEIALLILFPEVTCLPEKRFGVERGNGRDVFYGKLEECDEAGESMTLDIGQGSIYMCPVRDWKNYNGLWSLKAGDFVRVESKNTYLCDVKGYPHKQHNY